MARLFHQPGRWAGAVGLVLLGLRAAAQAPPGWALKLTPQHLVMSGLWFEVERPRSAQSRQTITLGPQLYWGTAGHPDVAYDPNTTNPDRTVRGAGLQAQYRYYVGAQSLAGSGQPLGFYLGGGPQVQFFRLGVTSQQWHEEIGIGNLPYLVYGPVTQRASVLRYGVAGQVGYQLALTGRVLVDVYAGLGLRKSSTLSGSGEGEFRTGSSDYAHEGLYFPAGFKIGAAF